MSCDCTDTCWRRMWANAETIKVTAAEWDQLNAALAD